MQFSAGFQSFKEDVDTQHEDQHYEDDGNRKVVPREIGATDMKVVIGSSEALAYHASHTDEHTPQRESSMSEMGGLRKILSGGGRCHRRCVSVCQFNELSVGEVPNKVCSLSWTGD